MSVQPPNHRSTVAALSLKRWVWALIPVYIGPRWCSDIDHTIFLKESGKVAARHILGKSFNGIKPTFVWSSFGGLHLRSAGSYLNQYSDVKYISTGDKHVCLYYNKETGK